MEQTTSPSAAQPAPPPAPTRPADWLKAAASEYVRSNVMTLAWSAFLLFGGLIFLLHFIDIGFIPDLNLGDSVFLLCAAAITGFYYLGVLSAGLIFPSVAWSAILNAKTFRALRPKDHLKRLRLAALFLGVPLVVLSLAYSLSTHRPGWPWADRLIRLAPYALPLGPAVTTYVFYLRRKKVLRRARRAGVTETTGRTALVAFRSSLIYWPTYAGSCLLFLIPFVMLRFIAWRVVVDDEAARVATLFLSLTLIVLMNVIAATVPGGGRGVAWRAAVGGIVCLGLLILLQSVASVSTTIMRVYGLGGVPGASVVVNKDGCAILEQVGAGPAEAKGETCRADGVIILSRLGTTYYFLQTRASGAAVRFTLPSSVVLSLKTEAPAPGVTPTPSPTPGP
jgi:hypothetical protein